MKYTVIIEKDPESGWYVGKCMQVPGAVSQGETYEELMENMKDAISLVLDYYKDQARTENAGRHVFYRSLEMA
jgi:predicted RNase H-like HicB family nuclease